MRSINLGIEICRNCGNPLIKNKKPRTGRRGFGVRPKNAVNCSKKCSREGRDKRWKK